MFVRTTCEAQYIFPFSCRVFFLPLPHPLVCVDVGDIQPSIVWSRGAVLGLTQRKSQTASLGFVARVEGGWMVRFAGCACLLVRDVVCSRSDANSVQNHLKESLQPSSAA